MIKGMLGTALRYHRAGRLNEAERIYRQILEIDSQQADSLHLLGMIAYQAQDYERAIGLIRKAIAIRPADAAYHSNLGTIFHAQGNLDEAAHCYEHALALQPDLAKTRYNLGTVLHAQGKLDEAAACYERALALQPTLAEAHYNLGNVLQSQGRLEEAVARYERTLALEPGKCEAHHNLGNALQAQDKLDEAAACYERALAVNPDYAKAHFSLGSVFHSLGQLDAALDRYRTALALQPDLAEAAFSLGLAQLLQGEFSEGWRNYESRWQTKEHTPPMRAYRLPLWRGEKLGAGRLLIWGEQGIGDEIMFAGLVPDVMGTGHRCILDCDARLRPLFARSFSGRSFSGAEIDVVSSQASGEDPGRDPELQVAAHIPSGSLPGLFRATHATFAGTRSPYLIADSAQRDRFRASYGDGRLLGGLAWYTNNRKTGRTRSVELSALAPLFALRGIRWITLQYGDHDALEEQVAASCTPLLVDRSVDQFADLDRFAAQIAAMDFVVTIDNSTAHLAGALGVPTYVLLPFAPDWRWQLERDDSPWYPMLRLFRQPRGGDWKSVVRKVQAALSLSISML
ncbi:MAG TPA: tetratricopeptide repeat-containing glycosyltransferase family protein [Terriglobales bacterium]|nr:tetratricopeptide repeat-containing glycosyltransferase family protein [Terriglobales bacterium]